MDCVERLWVCPECGVVVKAKEAEPPLLLDAEEVIECVTLVLKISNWGKIMRRVYLGMPFLRFGCWLAGMDLEVQDAAATGEEGDRGPADD